MKNKFILFLALTITVASSFNPKKEEEWKADLIKMVAEFAACGNSIPPNSPCNIFLGKALKRVYNISDFDKPNGQFLSANEIANYVMFNTDKWTLLGDAGNQTILENAQDYANLKKPVIAVFYNAHGHGHVALILPGNTIASGQWKLNCPNSASFFLDKPKNSYVGMHLGYAFSTPKDVKLYGRNFSGEP